MPGPPSGADLELSRQRPSPLNDHGYSTYGKLAATTPVTVMISDFHKCCSARQAACGLERSVRHPAGKS